MATLKFRNTQPGVKASCLLLLYCILFSMIACGCTQHVDSTISVPPSPKVVRLALAPYQDALVPILGEVKGWYKNEGLAVDIKLLAMSEMQEALAAGAIDVAWNNIGSIICTHEKNPDAVYAYGFNIFDGGYALMGRPNGPIKPLSYFLSKFPDHKQAVRATAAQLKGHTVVTTSKTDMEQAVYSVAKQGGLNFVKDVTIEDFNPDEGLAAFLAGTGDAYLGGIPQRTRANKEGMIEILAGGDIGPPELNGFITTKQFAQQHSDELLKLLHVWFHCVHYVNENMNDAGAIVVAKLNSTSGANFSVADFKRFWNKIEHYPPNPAAIQRDILSKDGKCYWLKRWDDCNLYFTDITKTISRPVAPHGVFIMPDIQQAYVARYGDQ